VEISPRLDTTGLNAMTAFSHMIPKSQAKTIHTWKI